MVYEHAGEDSSQYFRSLGGGLQDAKDGLTRMLLHPQESANAMTDAFGYAQQYYGNGTLGKDLSDLWSDARKGIYADPGRIADFSGQAAAVVEVGLLSGGLGRGSAVRAGVAAGAPENPSFNSIMRQVEKVDVSTPRDGAVFWTGYERGNQTAAMKWAAANGKYTIEMTPGGRWLNSLDLYGPNSLLTRAQADAAWVRMSERFTEGASGHVNAFTRGTSYNPASTFYNTELRGLRRNPNVSPTITYRGY